jgi:hypothetical protein
MRDGNADVSTGATAIMQLMPFFDIKKTGVFVGVDNREFGGSAAAAASSTE